MPVLYCNPDNHHPDSQVSFEINFPEDQARSKLSPDANWLSFELVFNIGKERRIFRSIDRIETTYTGIPGQVGKFALALKPVHELNTLTNLLDKFLRDTDIPSIRFEPADPSFEIIIERTHIGDFKVYVWVDAGNTNQLEYTWDAQGIRFLTNAALLKNFLDSLLHVMKN
jgi:hypothetical protein